MQFLSKLAIICLFMLVFLALACTPEDSDRCGSDYDYINGWCVPKIADSGPDLDGGDPDDPDGGQGTPTGMGEICSVPADCEGYQANFCLQDPATGDGFCTVTNCSKAPDDCPADFVCCIFPGEFLPPFCLPEIAYDEVHQQYGCEG